MQAQDHFWQEMGELTQPGDIQQKHFPHLSQLCKVLLDEDRLTPLQLVITVTNGALNSSCCSIIAVLIFNLRM